MTLSKEFPEGAQRKFLFFINIIPIVDLRKVIKLNCVNNHWQVWEYFIVKFWKYKRAGNTLTAK
ncbi:MAG: hypothetical protein JSV73_04085, partial [Flavobacteriaceae bacterium]